MKKILYIVSFLLVGAFWSCNQDIDFPYEGKDRIQFKHFTLNYNNTRIYQDSLLFSFGLKPDEIRKDTLKIVVELMGNMSETERKYKVKVIPDSTTVESGKHYEPFDEIQTFRSGKINDTLRIIINRDYLKNDYVKLENDRLDLALVPSEDFDLGLAKGHKIKVILNDYLSEPVWWKGNFGTSLGYFHPKKWRKLIEFSDKFADSEKCVYNANNEGRSYTTGLDNYLRAVPTYDYKDGKKYRLKMYEMVLVEE